MQATTHAERSYAVYGEFATGGMATVHYGRVTRSGGFARTIAVKKLHPHFAKDPDFFAMFLDEARLAVRIHHPNVVDIFDVVAQDDEVFLVMDYVHGESLSSLLRRARANGESVDIAIVASVVGGALHGLHAAHEAKDENGSPLHIVHRDVSPQNILVGIDGGTRVLDFGVARAAGQRHATRQGEIKGKLAYMSPEQLDGQVVDRRSDVYSAGVVCWEMLAGRRLFEGDSEGSIVTQVLRNKIAAPSTLNPAVSAELDRVVLTALSKNPARRFPSARDMAIALESATTAAGPITIGEWVQDLAGDVLDQRAQVVARIESGAPMISGSADDATSGTRVLQVRGDTLRSKIRSTASRQSSAITSRKIWPIALGVAALIGLSAVGIARLRHEHSSIAESEPALPNATTSTVSSSAASSAADNSQSTDTPVPPSTGVTASTAPASAIASHAEKPDGKPPSRIHHVAPHADRASSSGSPRAPNCDPPYAIVSGVKLPKPECPLD